MALFDWSEIGRRLIELQIHLNFKRSKHFAEALGLDNSYFAKAQKGHGIKFEHLELITGRYNISKYWLLFGEGRMLKNGENDPEENMVNEPKAIYQRDTEIEYLRKRVQDLERIISLQQKIIEGTQENSPPNGDIKNAG